MFNFSDVEFIGYGTEETNKETSKKIKFIGGTTFECNSDTHQLEKLLLMKILATKGYKILGESEMFNADMSEGIAFLFHTNLPFKEYKEMASLVKDQVPFLGNIRCTVES